jgi:hypothetical protein
MPTALYIPIGQKPSKILKKHEKICTGDKTVALNSRFSGANSGLLADPSRLCSAPLRHFWAAKVKIITGHSFQRPGLLIVLDSRTNPVIV